MFGRRSRDFSSDFAYLHHRMIRCISTKNQRTYRETILGRDGIINISDGEMIVICQNTEVVRMSLNGVEIAEFMSHDGFTVRDLNDPDADIINIYYTK